MYTPNDELEAAEDRREAMECDGAEADAARLEMERIRKATEEIKAMPPMERAAHSPGPWAQLGFSGHDLTLGIDIEPRTETTSGPVIARVHVTNRNEHARRRAEANARLIAASPELLEALRTLMDDYNQSYQDLTDGQYGKNPGTPAWKAAAAALAKAEGRV